jgi:hypothetical protein
MTKTNIISISLMRKFEKIVIASLIVTIGFTILSLEGFSLNEIIAQEDTEDKGYNFAEDTVITGIFHFNDGSEISHFEVFRQISGFQAKDKFVFELEKIVGSNPLLHKEADRAFLFRNDQPELKERHEFDIKIVISQGSEQKRAFEYTGCIISDYSVFTKTDNEEGWTQGKGFAVVDQFEFLCDDIDPLNPVYEDMMSDKSVASTESSMDYQRQQKSLGRQ